MTHRTNRVAMYVAKDLDHWITDEPHIWAERVTISGKAFVRLTPEVVGWFRERIDKAEAACAAGKLDVGSFGRIVSAFCPVYEFAVRSGFVLKAATGAKAESERATS
jgi:hypothetical protein